jgi:hypothetical protein
MTIDFKVKLIRNPISDNGRSPIWQENAFQWKVLLNNQDFDYYTGNRLVDKIGRPKKPTVDDVLHSLLSDYEAMEMSFYEWCDTFGYEHDSIEAQRIYMLCQQNGLKINKIGIDIAAERERLQDY